MTTSILIFGASGDLTRRKLVPALFNQFKKGKLDSDFNIVGISRSKFTHEEMNKSDGEREFLTQINV